MSERPPDVPLPNFIRYCADDLKTLYFEGHLAMKPGPAAGDRPVVLGRDRGGASATPSPRSAQCFRRARWKSAAFGIAR